MDSARTTPSRYPGTLPHGRRLHATVLFSDLTGYTALNEALDPEEVAELLNQILGGAGSILEAHGGTVNQFAGDQVKAVFGIPTAHDDDPRRAVSAALELHRFVRELDADMRSRLGHALRLHSGINTGLVVTQQRDSREGVFGLTGDAVNTAARLLSQAEPDEILIGPTTYQSIEPYFLTERVGDLTLRGKKSPVSVHRVTGGRRDTKFEAARHRGLSTYAGREREHARLEHCVAQAVNDGRGRFVSIVGQAGLGKSRLFHELTVRLGTEKTTVISGRCEPYGNVSPYHPFVQAIRALLVPKDVAGTAELGRLIASRVRDIDPGLEPYLALYLHLLSISDEAHPLPESLRDERLRLALQDALAALLSHCARREPIVVLLEDWHWADDASDATLRHLARYLSLHPVLLVVSSRPGTVNWGTLRPLVLTLQPLDAAETEVVASSRLGARQLPDELIVFLHERTGGNPFFIEELCRVLNESGAVAGRNDTIVLMRALAEFPMPESVQAVVRARIDRLPEGARDLLGRASVLGKRFPLRLLQRIAGDQASLHADLHCLADVELLGHQGGDDDAWFEFQHVIVQEVAYDTLLLQERRDLHTKAAHAIEDLYADNLDPYIEALAEHYVRSGDPAPAAVWAERAGDKAARAFSLREVRISYSRAIAALDRLEPTPERIRRRVDLSVKWGEACVYHPAPEYVATLRQSYDLAVRLGYDAGALRNLYWLAWVEHAIGDHRASYEHSEQCLKLVAPLADRALEARLIFNLGQESYHFTDYDRSEAMLQQAMAMRRASERRGGATVLASSLGYLALIDVERGAFEKAYHRFDEALAMIRRAGQLQLEATVTTMLGYAQVFQGCWTVARETTGRIRALNERLDSAAIRAMVDAIDGVACFHDGRPDRGIEVLRRAVAEHETSGARMALSFAYAELAIALATQGNGSEASELAHKALARCEVGDCPGEIAALRALALATAPDWSSALGHADEAIRRSVAKRSRREEAMSRLARASILDAAGRQAAARAEAQGLLLEFQAMDMPWHLARADALARPATH
jgi:class 3 adenylate cyclase/tetratricopeptide (TPR) repeat protein